MYQTKPVAAMMLLATVTIVMTGCSVEESPQPPIVIETPASIEVSIPASVTPPTFQLLGPQGVAKISKVEGDEWEIKGDVIVLRSRLLNPYSHGVTEASRVLIKKDMEGELEGKTIRVTLTARMTNENPSEKFAIAYSTARSGNSGWQEFTPTTNFNSYSFDYTIPSSEKTANFDFIGIHADRSATGKGIEIKSLSLAVIP